MTAAVHRRVSSSRGSASLAGDGGMVAALSRMLVHVSLLLLALDGVQFCHAAGNATALPPAPLVVQLPSQQARALDALTIVQILNATISIEAVGASSNATVPAVENGAVVASNATALVTAANGTERAVNATTTPAVYKSVADFTAVAKPLQTFLAAADSAGNCTTKVHNHVLREPQPASNNVMSYLAAARVKC